MHMFHNGQYNIFRTAMKAVSSEYLFLNHPGIHSKNLVAILHLLVALARLFRAPIRLPENVSVNVVVVQVGP